VAAASALKKTASAIPRTPIVPADVPPNGCKIVCWNVAGLRGTLKNSPDIFNSIVAQHDPHIICLQETKIQTSHEGDFDHILPQYTKYWASSTAKKGYAGTVN